MRRPTWTRTRRGHRPFSAHSHQRRSDAREAHVHGTRRRAAGQKRGGHRPTDRRVVPPGPHNIPPDVDRTQDRRHDQRRHHVHRRHQGAHAVGDLHRRAGGAREPTAFKVRVEHISLPEPRVDVKGRRGTELTGHRGVVRSVSGEVRGRLTTHFRRRRSLLQRRLFSYTA